MFAYSQMTFIISEGDNSVNKVYQEPGYIQGICFPPVGNIGSSFRLKLRNDPN